MTGLTCDRRKQTAVQNYIGCYFNHLNWPDKHGLTGTIYDYTCTAPGQKISRDDYDSADSYAATFITLLRAYYENGGMPILSVNTVQE